VRRTVNTVTVDQPGAWDHPGGRDPAAPAPAGGPAPADSPVEMSSRNAATSLLSAEEVSRAVGVPVTVTAAPGAVALAVFGGPDGKPVLTLQIINSRLLRMARFLVGAQRSGSTQPVPGVGTEAWVDGDRAFARLPDGSMLVMALIDRPNARAHLPELLATAVSRIGRARV
jgi:hypothetical protein